MVNVRAASFNLNNPYTRDLLEVELLDFQGDRILTVFNTP
jgi:hypothetical protein